MTPHDNIDFPTPTIMYSAHVHYNHKFSACKVQSLLNRLIICCDKINSQKYIVVFKIYSA